MEIMFKKPKRNFRRRQDSDAEDDAAKPDEDHKGPVVIRTKVEPVGTSGNTIALMDAKPLVPALMSQDAGGNDDDDEETNAFDLAQQMKEKQKMEKQKMKKKKPEIPVAKDKDGAPSSLLSFDDLEETDVDQPFKIKKSKESRRLEREMKKEKKLEKARKQLEELETTNIKDIKKETEKLEDTYIDAGDIRIKVKSFNIPASSSGTTLDIKPGAILTAKDEEEEDEEEEVDVKPEKPEKGERFGSARRRAEGPGLQRMLEEGKIPDAALIHAVRKRRQQLAEGKKSSSTGPAGSPTSDNDREYIPLTNAAKPSRSKGSRLVTEEQEYDEDQTKPMKFAVNQEAAQRQELRDNFMAAEHGSDEGSDEENDEALRRWEREQIKKGFTGAASGSGTATSNASRSISPSGMESLVGSYYGSTNTDSVKAAVAAAATASLSSNGVSAGGNIESLMSKKLGVLAGQKKADTIEDVKKRINERLESFEGVMRTHQSELDSLEDSLALTEHSITTHESDVSRLEKKFTFYQETRAYVTDLVDCLNEKLPRIEALEASIHALWRKRADRLVKRYQTDVKDMAAQYSANASKGFDQDMRRRIVERENRRMRRRQARAAATSSHHEEGLSTDEEENQSDKQNLQTERLRLIQASSEVWSDVVEDFHKLDIIKQRFETWKREFGDTYQNAFVAFCLPGLFAPFVRLSLIGWSPLEPPPARGDDLLAIGSDKIEDAQWFESLLMYNASLDHLTDASRDTSGDTSRDDDNHVTNGSPTVKTETSSPKVNGVEADESDDDYKLLPRVVEKVVIPKLKVFVEDVWNPMSTTQTKRLSGLLQHLVDEYPTVHMDSKNVQALVKAVIARLKRTLTEDIYMPLYSKDAISDKESDSYLFFNRQMWSCIKLFGNMFSWASFVGVAQLQEMAFDSLLNRYMLIGLLTVGMGKDGLRKCRAVVDRVPEDWLKKVTKLHHDSGGKKDSAMPPLANFAKHIRDSSSSYGRDRQSDGETAFKEARDVVKQAAYLLCDIYAYDHAKCLAELFSFKI